MCIFMDHNIYFTDSLVLFVVFGWHVKFWHIRWVTVPHCVALLFVVFSHSESIQTYTHTHTLTLHYCSIVSHWNQIQASMSSTTTATKSNLLSLQFFLCYSCFRSSACFLKLSISIACSLSLSLSLCVCFQILSKFNLIINWVYQSPSLGCLYSITYGRM